MQPGHFLGTRDMSARPVSASSLDALAIATAAFHRGDYAFALQAVEAQNPTTKAHCLRSSILRRLGRASESYEASQWAANAAQDDEDRVLAACSVATSYLMQARDDDAIATLDTVESVRTCVSDFARGRLGFTRALIAWKQERAADAERYMMEAYRCDDPFERMCSLQLHAFIRHLDGRYRDAVDMLVKALRASDGANSVPWTAEIISSLTFLTSEIDVSVRREGEPPTPEVRTHKHEVVDLPDLRRRIRELPWTDHLAEQRFWATRNLGLRLTTDGGIGAHLGIILLRQSADCATTGAQRTLALLDSAQAGFNLEEPEHGAAFLTQAREAAAEVDWTREDGDERLGLLILSELMAPRDAVQAREYLDAFHALPPMNGMLSLSHGNRLPAMIAHAEGVVSRYASEREKAVERLRFALRTFASIGYKWRASSAALNLYEITNDQRYRLRADALAKGHPQSWIHRLDVLERPP